MGKARYSAIPVGSNVVTDAFGATAVLLPDAWSAKTLETQNKDWVIEATPPRNVGVVS